MGDPDRAHRYFAKNPSFALIKKKFAWIKILHRLPTPSAPELAVSYYYQEDTCWKLPKNQKVGGEIISKQEIFVYNFLIGTPKK